MQELLKECDALLFDMHGLNCFSVPKYHGVDLLRAGAGDLFYLFLYLYSHYDLLGLSANPDYLLSYPYDLDALERYVLTSKLGIAVATHPIRAGLCDEIRGWLKAGHLVLVPHDKSRYFYSQEYGKRPFPHLLLIKGYDSETDRFLISDYEQNNALFQLPAIHSQIGDLNSEFYMLPALVQEAFQSYNAHFTYGRNAITLLQTSTNGPIIAKTDALSDVSNLLQLHTNSIPELLAPKFSHINRCADISIEERLSYINSQQILVLMASKLAIQAGLDANTVECLHTAGMEAYQCWKQTVMALEVRERLGNRAAAVPDALRAKVVEAETSFLQLLCALSCQDVEDVVASSGEARYMAPTTETERILAGIWCDVLGIDTVGIHANFFAMGGHSLLVIRLLLEVEREFGLHLSLAEMLKAQTVRKMEVLLSRKQQGASPWSALVPLQPLGNRPPLFCAPPGGGSIFYYRTLAAYIGKDQPLYALEPRGMSGTLPPHETIEETAAYYIEQIRTVQTRGPYYLGGYSAGGVIAYEMARQLQGQGEVVALVLLLDTSTPEALTRRQSSKLRQEWWRLRFHSTRYMSELSACASRGERLAYLKQSGSEVLEWVRGTVQGKVWAGKANPMRLALPEAYKAVGRAEEKARMAYRVQSYGGCVRLLQSQVSWPGDVWEPQLGWGELAEGDFEVITVPGTHYSFLEEPCIRISAAHIRRILAETQQTQSKA